MTEMKTTTRRSHKKTAETKTDDQTATPARPNGKLGQLVERLETAEGATLAELSTLTDWQPYGSRRPDQASSAWLQDRSRSTRRPQGLSA
jgi:hypothetical protein